MSKVDWAIIPAAGLGTRFLPATKTVPKEMFPIGSKPLLHNLLEEIKEAGINNVVIVTHPEKASIEAYFEDSKTLSEAAKSKPGVAKALESIKNLPNIHFVYQEERRGLGHAILCAKEFIKSEYFCVALPDEVFIAGSGQQNIISRLVNKVKELNQSVVATLKIPMEKVSQYGVVALAEEVSGCFKVTDIIEKPAQDKAPSNSILPGRYVLSQSIFTDLEEGFKKLTQKELYLTDSLLFLAKTSGLLGLEAIAKRFDTGRPEGYLEAQNYYAKKS